MRRNSQESGAEIRLLFLCDHLGHAGGFVHGATTYYLNVLPELRQAGVAVTACFLRGRHPAAAKLEAAGIESFFLNGRKYDPRAFMDIRRLLREKRIQIVHAAGEKSMLLGRAAAHWTKRPVIIHLHDMFPPGSLLGKLQRRMAGWTDLCLVVSNAAVDFARKEFGMQSARIMTLYNGIRLEAFPGPDAGIRKRLRSEFGYTEATPVIAVIGRLAPEKGHLLLLEAFPELLATHPEARLLVVGDGPTRRSCEELVASLHLEHAICFAGQRDDVAEILAAIDLVAIPSLTEGLSYVAIEAMASQRPVVAFRVGGLAELVTDGETGLLVPPGDASGLVAALRRCLEDAGLAKHLGKGGRKFAGNFSIQQHVQLLLFQYRRLIDHAARGNGYVAPDS